MKGCSVAVLWGMTSGRRFFVSLSFRGQRREEGGGTNEKSGMLFYREYQRVVNVSGEYIRKVASIIFESEANIHKFIFDKKPHLIICKHTQIYFQHHLTLLLC